MKDDIRFTVVKSKSDILLPIVCISFLVVVFACIAYEGEMTENECKDKGGILVSHIGCVNQEEYNKLVIK